MRVIYLFLSVLMSCNLLAQPVAEGNIVLHLNFDNNSLLDLSDNNHNVINHQTSFTDGCDNEGLNLEGDNNFLEISHSNALEIPDQVSISFWYQHALQDGSGFYSLVEQSANEFGGHSRYGAWLFNQNIVWACVEPDICPNGSTLCQRCITSNTTLEVGEWYHIVSTYDGGSQKLYINGQLDSEEIYADATGISVRPYPLTIGTDMYDPNPIYLKGKMDEILLYNIALTSEQVDTLFQQKNITSTSPLNHNNTFTFFPNPAKTYIEYQTPITIDVIRFYNMTGRLVKEELNNTSNKIDIGNLNAGFYTVVLQGNGQVFNRKLYVINE